MSMSFDDYIQNPMGKENAVISNRNMYRDLYKAKLDKILVRENGKIEYKCYSIGIKYLCYLKIPSEVVPNFYYDVLIEFTPPKKLIHGGSLKDFSVRFFSNDPSFVYTFAHAFIKNGLFITTFEDKMSKEAIQKVAKEKNPNNQVGYVKSLYFAYLFMQSRGLFNKLRYVDIYRENAVKREIMHADEKIKLRQELASSEAKKKARERKREQDEVNNDRNNIVNNIPVSRQSNKINSVRTNSFTKKVKTVGKTTKHVKKI